MAYRHASEYFPDTLLQWVDVVLLILFFLVCTGQRGFAFPDIASIQFWEGGILVLLISLWKSIFSFMHAEHSLTLYLDAWKEVIIRNCVTVTLGWALTLVCIYLINSTIFLFDLSEKGRSLFYFDSIQSTFVWLGVLLLLFLPYRIAIALLYQKKYIQRPLTNALIVGLNGRSLALAENLWHDKSGYNLLGFADTPEEKYAQLYAENAEALELVSSLEKLEEYIRTHPVDEIFLTLPVRSFYDEFKKIIQYSTEMGLTVRVLNDLFTFKKGIFQYIEGDLAYFTADSPLPDKEEDIQTSIKFLLEKIIACCALIFCIPLFLIVWVLNFFHWPFSLKKYIGLNKKKFRMVQFKEMQAIPFLQKKGVRHLPGLINIFLGDMSIIGPEPVPQQDNQKTYASCKDNTMLDQRRFMVKPGLISPRSIIKECAISPEDITSRGFLTECCFLIKFFKKRLTRLAGHGSN